MQGGNFRENTEFCGGKNLCREISGNLEKVGKIREFYKNMSGKYRGIFNLFHDIKNHRNHVIYMMKMSSLFYENHLNFVFTHVKFCNLLNMVQKLSINILSCGNYQKKLSGICFTKLSGHLEWLRCVLSVR